MGKFVVKKITNLSEAKVGDEFPESDYATILPNNHFVQMEFNDDIYVVKPHIVKPGIWSIQKTMSGLELGTTSFVNDKILSSFVNTKEITDKIDAFFNKIPVYKEMGFEVAKRAALLYGPPGGGKSTAISLAANKYTSDGKTAVIIWHTDKFEAFTVKDFIKSFKYEGVDKLILVAEDIGGVEIEQARIRSDSSLLSLLDNQERTFSIPTFILATTNYPENFMGNLTNRPNRFDDKIKVGYPTADQRLELLKFFGKELVTEEAEILIQGHKAKEFSPAHIRELIIRCKIYDKTLDNAINEMYTEIENYKNAFSEKTSMGI